MNWGQLLTAMVTPFRADHSVDWDRAAELARRLVDSGSDGIVVAGTTGESPTLTYDEKLRLFETVLNAVGDRAAVLANTGNNSTADSVALTRDAEKLGVAGIMAVVPYYNKPPQEGLYYHFKAIAEATSLPVLLYNVPGRTGANLAAATVGKLAEIPNIVAVKEASGNLDQVGEILRVVPPGFLVYSGDDSLTLPILAIGGHGVVSVASHVVGREMKEMIEAFRQGDVKKASEIHLRLLPLFKALFITSNPIPVKEALRLSGFDVGGLRPPLSPIQSKESEQLHGVMKQLGLC